MIESVIFSYKEGMGYISDDYNAIDELIDDVAITINNKLILPEQLTDLDAYYSREIKYLGVLKSNPKEMVFYIGSDKNIFETKFYYSSLVKITENRVFECFTYGSGRDMIFVNGKWK
jgi:hypothetical protein